MSTDLIIACEQADLKQVYILLKLNEDPNQTNYIGETPLHFAAYHGYLKISELLLKAGADPNKANRFGETSLHYAVHHGCLKTSELLLIADADPNKANIYGSTPLHWATDGDHSEIVELLNSYKNKISSLSLLCLRTIYRDRINTDGIPSMILGWNFHQ